MATAPRTVIYLQDACLAHQYIRNSDTANVVERPERIRAVKVGLAAAVARLEHINSSKTSSPEVKLEHSTKLESSADAVGLLKPDDSAGDLVAALSQMKIEASSPGPSSPLVASTSTLPLIGIVYSTASVNLLSNRAVKFIHGDIDGDVYLEKLISWAKTSEEKIAEGGSEIPNKMPQGDLYLCPGSIDAIQGALGTVCEAVDAVVSGPTSRAFVAIRPPGHHCGEDTPSGFCFVNNVAVAAAHAHLKHRVKRAIIFDIDLHHGNGTQSIAWQINEETYRQKLEDEHNPAATGDGGLQVFYGSIHDILSYPCEDGDSAKVQAASTNIHGAHGQYIDNIHLEPYTSDEHFWDILYPQKYSQLLKQARDFIASTGGPSNDTIVFISCGFDACEHEYESMSRHGRRVPTTFYHRFARDARRFADEHASGRLVSVLEGGYSDRALMSGAFAHFIGLSDVADEEIDAVWWGLPNLEKLEKATKKRRGPRKSAGTSGGMNAGSNIGPDINILGPAPGSGSGGGSGQGGGQGQGQDTNAWVTRACEVLSSMEIQSQNASSESGRARVPARSPRKSVPSSTRVLRERTPMPPALAGEAPSPSRGKTQVKHNAREMKEDVSKLGKAQRAQRVPVVGRAILVGSESQAQQTQQLPPRSLPAGSHMSVAAPQEQGTASRGSQGNTAADVEQYSMRQETEQERQERQEGSEGRAKRLPRVVLKLGPPPQGS